MPSVRAMSCSRPLAMPRYWVVRCPMQYTHTMVRTRFTSRDLETLPLKEGDRAEIIDGELYVSRQPTNWHQYTSNRVEVALTNWSDATGLGYVLHVPGLVFAEDDDVIPDVVWVTRDRFLSITDDKGHFSEAPELVVEVLSPGRANEFRDRQAKLDLYDRRGVLEYWIVSWERRLVDVYRREADALGLTATLTEGDTLTSPLLPGFSAPVAGLFFPVSQT